jgi:hypothetical protein
VLQYFAIERFLYRLSKSAYAEQFVLKGALMLNVWTSATLPRPTLDIDLLGQQINNAVDSIVEVVQGVCGQPVEADGLVFAPASVRGEEIADDAGYEGVRVRFTGQLGKARITMQLDVGFGDVVVPADERFDYPGILDFPPPHLRGYSKESTIAEKFEAAVRFGALNSRMKDFFDIWFLSRQFGFDGTELAAAIQKTFSTRRTVIPPDPVPLTLPFREEPVRIAQWRAFRRRSRLEIAPDDFRDVMEGIAAFLGPVLNSLAAGQTFKCHWKPSGPWHQDST